MWMASVFPAAPAIGRDGESIGETGRSHPSGWRRTASGEALNVGRPDGFVSVKLQEFCKLKEGHDIS
jgi:hypothetical protein